MAATWNLFAGIDGTGDYNDVVYAAEFSNSCVKEIKSKWNRPAMTFYHRGPDNADAVITTRAASEEAVRHILSFWTSGRNVGIHPRVFLAGYSRGGAAAIHTCRKLNEQGVPVHCLLLYDAVDMTVRLGDVGTIPGNVARCYHAMRNPATLSRKNWGNCGTRHELEHPLGREKPGTFLTSDYTFLCTHGGMGGVPWTSDQATVIGGHIQEPEVLGLEKVAGGMATGPAGFNRGRSGFTTTVSLADEDRESRRVRVWMAQNLQRELAR